MTKKSITCQSQHGIDSGIYNTKFERYGLAKQQFEEVVTSLSEVLSRDRKKTCHYDNRFLRLRSAAAFGQGLAEGLEQRGTSQSNLDNFGDLVYKIKDFYDVAIGLTEIRAIYEPPNNIKFGKSFVNLGWENYGLSVLDSGVGKYFVKMLSFVSAIRDGNNWESFAQFIHKSRKIHDARYKNWMKFDEILKREG